MEKLKIYFFLKSEKKNAMGEPAIYCKIKLNNSSATLSTGKHISIDRWKETTHLISKVAKKEESIKDTLRRFTRKAEESFEKHMKAFTVNLTAEMIKADVLGRVLAKKAEKSIMQAIEVHNHYFAALVKKGEKAKSTLYRYYTIMRIFSEFLKDQYGASDLPISKLDKHMVFRLDTYLRTQRVYRGNIGVAHNTSVKYMRNLKTIFNFILKQGSWIKNNPFLSYTEKVKAVKTIFLEQSELDAITNIKLSSKRLESVRAIFLFSCYTAFGPADSMKLTWDDVYRDEKGVNWIITERTKTHIEANVPLLPPALRIIESFKEDPRCAYENRLLPRYSNQKMNKYLKELAAVCEIKKNLIWYAARHTFATTITLNNNIPIEVVSRMMGHTNIAQTQHYARIQKQFISKHMSMLSEVYV